MTTDKGGCPKLKIDIKLVQKLCEIHCTGEEIASVVGVSYDTLVRRLKETGYGGFADLYKKYSEVGKASLRRLQWNTATKGNVSMQIWLGKQMLGQKDILKTENSNYKVPTIVNNFIEDLPNLDDRADN